MYLKRNNKRKMLLLGGIFGLFPLAGGFAQSLSTGEVSSGACGDMQFEVIGNKAIKIGQEGVRQAVSNSLLDQDAQIEHELRKGPELVTSTIDHQFVYSFIQTGNYELKTLIRRNEQCVRTLFTTISVVNHLWLGIGLDESEATYLAQSIQSQGVGFIALPGSTNSFDQEATLQWIQDIARYFPSSDVVFLNHNQARFFFNHLNDVRTYGIGFPERIVLLGNIGKSALRRLFYQSPMVHNFSDIIVAPSPYLASVAEHLIRGDSLQQLDVVQSVNTQQQTTTGGGPLAYMIDYLLAQGISLDFIIFLLCIPVIALVLVVLKQFIGIGIGPIPYILLTAASYLFVGPEITLLMFLATLIGQMLIQRGTKKIYLLYAPKIGLTLFLGCLLFLLFCFISKKSGRNISLPSDPLYVFFPLIVLSSIMGYLYPHHDSITNKTWRLDMVQFIAASIFVAFLLQRSWIQQFMLGNPDMLWIVLIALIYLGRYAGLQLNEYIRFWPLITKYFTDDEE